MTKTIARIRSFPRRYRTRMREVVRAYTLVNERDEEWIDSFHAHRLANPPGSDAAAHAERDATRELVGTRA